MTAKMTNTGQTEQRKQAARRMRKAESANSAAVSRILLSKLRFIQDPGRIELSHNYLIAVARHRVAGDDDIAVDLVAPCVPAGLSSAGKELQIWSV